MKKITLFLVSIIFSQQAFSQSPNWLWANGAGGSSSDLGYSIATDGAGNVYVTGSFQGGSITFGSITLPGYGYSDIFVAKFDPSGNALWAASAGGGNVDEGFGIATDAAGNVYVTGVFGSTSVTFGSTTLTNASPVLPTYDVFIVKYSSSGNVLWARRAGGLDNEYGAGLATDAAGNVFMTGFFESPSVTFGSTTLISNGPYDTYVVKYSSSGNVIWATGAGGTGQDFGRSIAADASGNAYVTGEFNSSSITFGSYTLTNGSGGASDVYIAKYNAAGSVLWAVSAGDTADSDYGRNIATDAAGNVYVTGDFSSYTITFGSATLTNSAFGMSDIFVVKLDAGGGVYWANSAVGGDFDYGRGIAADATGNVFVAGSFQSWPMIFGNDTIYNAGTSNIFVVKYDLAGNVIWANSLGGANYDYGQAIATDAGGNALMTGFFTSPSISFGSTTLTNASAGTNDVFIAKLGDIPTVVAEADEENLVSLSPNPVTSELVVRSSEFGDKAEIEIYNVLGEKVFEKRLTSDVGRPTISVADFSSGIYFVKVRGEKEERVGKFVKQ